MSDIFQTVFGAETQDTFIKFLFRMFGMQVMNRNLKDENGQPIKNPYCAFDNDFFPKAAEKIVEDLFTQEDKGKLVRLISELKKKPSLIERAEKEEEAELANDQGGYIRGVFNEVKARVPESLTLIALIKIDSSNFEKSHEFLKEIWRQLQLPPPKENEPDNKPHCNLGELRICIWDALDDLEELVGGEKGQNKAEEREGLEKQTEQNIEKYLKSICEKIKRELEKESVKESELDAEIQIELTSLKNGDFSNKEVIDEIEEKISNNIKLKKAEKELNKLLGSYNQKFSPKARGRLLKKLNELTKNNSPFYQQVYQKRREEVQKLIKQLEDDNHLQQIDSAKDGFPLAVKSMIGGYLLLTMVIIFKKMPSLRK